MIILASLNSLELSLISRLKNHPLMQEVSTIPWNDLLMVLIQRRYLSLSIVNTYEFVIDALIDEPIKKTVREILHEEYPRTTKGVPLPSHREHLFNDLLHMGATAEMILATPESPTTRRIRNESYQLLLSCLESSHRQAGLVALLRFWGEVLVSVEYECFWKRISERLGDRHTQDKKRSEFYYFHMIHDSRGSDVGHENLLGGLTHSQELAVHLQGMLQSKETVNYCLKLEEAAFQLKYQFYDQFSKEKNLSNF
jgi:hypothetical protein